MLIVPDKLKLPKPLDKFSNYYYLCNILRYLLFICFEI
ncbi:hypothetical protein A1OE_1411 [Candidatus Endolissoclinum faulkneri L2]|uniref:Uncharacterized protein n=1 Tax=Candidatus Endolissoclinum faulkneri L2 TaxID=1193729 RepID=K7YIX8_9PROT|nr:hypothetical protein A1OE_1411 [Candidatus Endolissoclinum faulkneri L2]